MARCSAVRGGAFANCRLIHESISSSGASPTLSLAGLRLEARETPLGGAFRPDLVRTTASALLPPDDLGKGPASLLANQSSPSSTLTETGWIGLATECRRTSLRQIGASRHKCPLKA